MYINTQSNTINQGLKLSHWNVHGFYGKDDTNKDDEGEIVKFVKRNDIVFLSETHCSKDYMIDYEGYICHLYSRDVTCKINRYFGGLAILYKQELQNGLTILKQTYVKIIFGSSCVNAFSVDLWKKIILSATHIFHQLTLLFTKNASKTLGSK